MAVRNKFKYGLLAFLVSAALTGCGLDGDDGAQGETGAQGPQGEQGEPGTDGSDGTDASIGIATNKLIAKIASAYCKPNGMLWIAPGSEQQFLAPLPIKRIPGIGRKGSTKLNRMGVHSVADLARLPLEILEET